MVAAGTHRFPDDHRGHICGDVVVDVVRACAIMSSWSRRLCSYCIIKFLWLNRGGRTFFPTYTAVAEAGTIHGPDESSPPMAPRTAWTVPSASVARARQALSKACALAWRAET